MRLNQTVIALQLAMAVALCAAIPEGADAAQEPAGPTGAESVALDDTVAVQDVTAALERHRVDLGGGSGAGETSARARDADAPWFALKLANTTSLPMERLLVVRRPALAGAGWSVGTSSALPQGAAVEWVGPGAPEPLPPVSDSGGAGVFRFAVPAGGRAQLAAPGAEGPVVAAVMTRSAFDAFTSLRFVMLGLGFGLLGALAALSLARWLGAGDRAAAASAAVGLSAIWVLGTQFGHHLAFIGAGSPLDTGLKAAGLCLLAGALLFSVRSQVELSNRFLSVLTWCALGCVMLALAVLPGWGLAVAAGPVLAAATVLALAAAATDAVKHTDHLSMRLPDLASLVVLAAVLAAAGVMATMEPILTVDRWSVALYGVMIVSLAVLGGSGLVVHHGVAVPLIEAWHPPVPEPPKERSAPSTRAAAEPVQVGVPSVAGGASESVQTAQAPEGAGTSEAPAAAEEAEISVAQAAPESSSAPEVAAGTATPALGPEPPAPDLAAHEIAAEQTPDQVTAAGKLRAAEIAAGMKAPIAGEAAEVKPPPPEPEILRDLREALQRREIKVAYQPVVSLADGSVSGFEALARWERKGHGPVSPDTFIPLAEEAGLIEELGDQILRRAAHRLGEWRRRHGETGAPLHMNVNVSALQLVRPEFARLVSTVIEEEQLEPGTLTLELTESILIDDPERAAEDLNRLKEKGVHLALDDFGTGYSSLNYLRVLPFDSLKIDRDLLAGMEEERGERILRAVIALAHDLGMTVVAEGVQKASDLENLRTLRCDYVQGPFCGPPLAAAAAEAILRKEKDISPPDESDVTA